MLMQLSQNLDKLLDWQNVLTALFVVIIAFFRSIYSIWSKNKDKEEETKESENQYKQADGSEVLVNSYQELVFMLRDEVRRLREDVETLSDLRVENTKLRHRIVQLENKNRDQAEEISIMKAKIVLLEGVDHEKRRA
jgi:cell shape-determining protein MreC